MASSRKAPRASDARGLLAHLRVFFETHLSPRSSLTLGFSGGLDSCVLLHILSQLRAPLVFQLFAVHVNHQISPDASLWEKFCEELCGRLDVPLTVVKVEVPRDTGLGLEAAARETRYQVLLQHCAGDMVLAHHRDDQAETLMLQLLRGAGVAGLAAMPAVGELKGTKVLRPLLDASRAMLHQYALENSLRWVEDESNRDSRYDRNFLRNEVFPLLASRFPACAVTLARSAANFADSAELLAQLAEQDAADACQPGRLSIKLLRALPLVRAANVLRWWLHRETGVIPGRSHLYEMLHQCCYARPDAQVACLLDKAVLRRYRQWVCIDSHQIVDPYCLEWGGQGVLQLPDGSKLTLSPRRGAGLREDVISSGLTVSNLAGRPANGVLSMKVDPKRPSRSLKNLWQEAGIPPWDRQRIPLLWREGRLVAIPGLGCAPDFGVGAGETGFVIELG